ncbi:TIGR03086 family metal-binding protein [Streptomyces sp. ASQP_92]|uniref:TIGR03086 family metal-binding protein n=1 Tax=Streptomyces sp. ASQP_92 TaxID=2979116 RepID=UPI0021BE2D5D|nr:TIGR03086 family metal-binding protein [Streptomyces sp. ASQP_92]MCT9092799.1 TIGR03086 family metal-binding protein [Streptomyces sp. ASQP_92]
MSSEPNAHALPDLGPAAAELTRLLGGVRDDQLGASTPCPAYALRELLAHVLGLSVAFQHAARKETGPSTATAPGSVPPPELPADWRELMPESLAAMAAAWRDPAAWEGETQAGGLTLPAAVTGQVALDELVVHGWDVARATGQDYRPAPADLEISYAFLAPSKDDPAARGNAFGPPVDVPDGAPMLDRLIGMSGRDPGWKA